MPHVDSAACPEKTYSNLTDCAPCPPGTWSDPESDTLADCQPCGGGCSNCTARSVCDTCAVSLCFLIFRRSACLPFMCRTALITTTVPALPRPARTARTLNTSNFSCIRRTTALAHSLQRQTFCCAVAFKLVLTRARVCLQRLLRRIRLRRPVLFLEVPGWIRPSYVL